MRHPGVVIALATLLFALLPLPMLASSTQDNGQRVRELDDPIVADLEDILLESGSLFLSYAAPYSDAELRSALGRIDPDKLSDSGRIKYDRIREALRPDPGYTSGELAAKAKLDAALDANWRSDDEIPWVLGYQRRPSFLAFSAEAWAGSWAYGYSEADLKRDYRAVNDPLSSIQYSNFTSLPIDFIDTDGSFPFRAFGAAGGDFWDFKIGRDKLSLGSMDDDNLVVSSTPEWYDYARLAFFFRDFEYSGYLVQLDPERNLYMHRAEFLFFDRLSVGLTEGMLVGDAAPELRFFDPFMILHGYEAWHDDLISDPTTGDTLNAAPTERQSGMDDGVGSMLGVELDYDPWKYLTLVAQYQFNAGRDPIKMLLWPNEVSTIPNSAAYLLGAKFRAPWEGGYLKGELCGAYSEPFDMVLGNDLVSYIYRRELNSNAPNPDGIDYSEQWIGFSEGPDCILASLKLGYETMDRKSLDLLISYRWKGQNDFSTVYAWSSSNSAERTPTGIVEGRFRIGAQGSLPIGEHWSLASAFYYTHRTNADNAQGVSDQSVELLAGVRLEF
jgi:hypothetical protein